MHYTDRLGQPLAVGDQILLALSLGASSAQLAQRTIVGIIPLVPHRDKTEPKMETVYDKSGPFWRQTGNIAGFYYMRADQDRNNRPTEFYRKADTPPEKLFVLQYEQVIRWGLDKGKPNGRKQSFDRIMDVVKIPPEA